MPPAGYPAFLQYLQSGRVSNFQAASLNDAITSSVRTFIITSLGTGSRIRNHNGGE